MHFLMGFCQVLSQRIFRVGEKWKTIQPQTMLWLAAFIYFVVMSYFSVVSHWGFRTQADDMWSLEKAIREISLDFGKLPDFFKVHLNFIFFPTAVIYKLFPFTETLLVLTTFACTLAGVGIFYFGKIHLRNAWHAAIFAIVFWLSHFTQGANLYDFHIVTFMAAFVAWSLWAFDSNRRKLGIFLLIALLSCKEETGLISCTIGMYLFFSKRRRMGLLIALFSLSFFFLANEVLLPYIRQGSQLSQSITEARYGWIGSSPLSISQAIVTKPLTIASHLAQYDFYRLFLWFLLLGGITALPAWHVLIIALPHLLIGALSFSRWNTAIVGTYYFIVSFCAVVLANIIAQSFLENKKPQSRPWPLYYLLAVTLLSSIAFSPLPYSLTGYWADFSPASHEEREALQDVKAILKDKNRPIQIQRNIISQFNENSRVTPLSEKIERPLELYHLRYIHAIDLCLRAKSHFVHYYSFTPVMYQWRLMDRVASKNWRILFEKGNFILFEKLQTPAEEPPLHTDTQNKLNTFLKNYSDARSQYKKTWSKKICRLLR